MPRLSTSPETRPFAGSSSTWRSHVTLRWWMVVFILFAPAALAGEPPTPIPLDGSANSIPLAGRSQAWVDTTGQWSIDEVESRAATLPFEPRDTHHRVNLGTQGVLWVRFEAWTQDIGNHWELEMARSGTDRISLYNRRVDGSWREQHAGDRVAVQDWASPDRYPVFSLETRTDVPVTYWVRIEHARVPYSGELFIHNHSHLLQLRMQQQFLLGAYFGMALLLSAVAVVNGLVFRDRSFLAYAGYITLLGLSLAASLGVGGHLFWPGSPVWNGLAEFVLLPMVAAAAILFVRQVAQPRRIGRMLDRLALTLAGLLLACTVWDTLSPTEGSFMVITVVATLTMVALYAMLWMAWRTGDRWLRWVVLGILPVLLTGTIPALRNFDLLSSGFLTQYAMVMAASIEAPMLLYGLLLRSKLQHEALARAHALDQTEPLTGLGTRHAFTQRLRESLVRAQRYRHRCALLLVELDNHGQFMSQHGREVADRALVLTASLLRSVARDVDAVARVNDQQFALLMEGPVRGTQAVSAATAIVAGGLRPTDELPVGSALRLKIVVALVPQDDVELDLDAKKHLHWLQIAMDELRRDPRRNIQPLNL